MENSHIHGGMSGDAHNETLHNWIFHKDRIQKIGNRK